MQHCSGGWEPGTWLPQCVIIRRITWLNRRAIYGAYSFALHRRLFNASCQPCITEPLLQLFHQLQTAAPAKLLDKVYLLTRWSWGSNSTFATLSLEPSYVFIIDEAITASSSHSHLHPALSSSRYIVLMIILLRCMPFYSYSLVWRALIRDTFASLTWWIWSVQILFASYVLHSFILLLYSQFRWVIYVLFKLAYMQKDKKAKNVSQGDAEEVLIIVKVVICYSLASHL